MSFFQEKIFLTKKNIFRPGANALGVGGLKRENGWFSLFLLWLYVFFFFFCRKKHFLFLLSAAKDQSNRGDLNGFLSNSIMKKTLKTKIELKYKVLS